MSNSEEQLAAMRHSLAHITAQAVQRLWPQARFGVGPVVKNGFYYDIDIPGVSITDSDFKKIEKEMRTIVNANYLFEQYDLPVDEAIAWAVEANQPYKLELLNDLKREGTTVANEIDSSQLGVASDGSKIDNVSFYKDGDFTDLCRGPHVNSSGDVGVFKLMRVAGAYWRGDETKPQMQRLYGVAFTTKEELDAYLQRLEEAKKRDHRKLGKSLDLYTVSDKVGSGLPLFTPRGTWLRELLSRYSQQLRADYGYERVWIPHITKKDLYETSGHWQKFGDELFLVTSQETSDELVLKPMNCPHHTQLFASQQRSYRDLPIRYMENTTVYRDEKSGELNGIERVRSITQDDCHVFCTDEQVGSAVDELIACVQEMYKTLEMPIQRVHLSFRDESDAYLGDADLWSRAEAQLEAMAKKNGIEYVVDTGEAAFYGPKIDFIAADAIGRETQVGTIQLDFVQPQRFELAYIDSDGHSKTPVMIHSALLGSIERFLSVYIEHTAGAFPFWASPEQVRVLTINDEVSDYTKEVIDALKATVLMKPLKYNELRYRVDSRNESLGKKIREAQKMKIPVMIIVGPKDAAAQQVSVRVKGEESTVALSELTNFLHEQN